MALVLQGSDTTSAADAGIAPKIYQQLDPHKNEIRLLRFRPVVSEFEDLLNVTCSLETVSLDASPLVTYIALSYMWGPMRNPDVHVNSFKVTADNQPFVVTLNLSLALICIRNRVQRGRRCCKDLD